MIKEFQNKRSRFYKVFFYRSFGMIFLSIILICWIIYVTYYFDSEKSKVVIVSNSIFLGLLWIIEYFRYFRFIIGFEKYNSDRKLIIDDFNQTIQEQNSDRIVKIEKHKIKKVILHTHGKNEIPFKNPKNSFDKIENYLQSGWSKKYKFANLWYVEIKSIDAKTFILTPVMISKDEIPFKEYDIEYENTSAFLLENTN